MENNNDDFDEIFDMDIRQSNAETDPKVLATKHIGDVVTIVDYSGVTADSNGKEIDDDVIEFDDEFIVVEVNQKHVFKQKYVSYVQDLVVINRRTQIKYRVPSHYTRIN